jgi:hypothetical protein
MQLVHEEIWQIKRLISRLISGQLRCLSVIRSNSAGFGSRVSFFAKRQVVNSWVLDERLETMTFCCKACVSNLT